LKNAALKEQWIADLEQELKQVWHAAAAKKNRLEDELRSAKPRRLLRSSILWPLLGQIFVLVVFF
jgi:hypothetical protein